MFVAYDVEIIKCIPSRDLDYDPKYQYARGWNDHKNLGISVISLVGENEWLTLCPEFYPEWRDKFLEFTSERLVGFNNHQFDNEVLKANGLRLTNTVDMLTEVRISAFGSPFYTDQPAGFKYNLGFIAIANGYAKSGEGSQAPKLWQDGEYDKVIEYCLNDTKITYALWRKFLAGELIDPNTGTKLKPPSI